MLYPVVAELAPLSAGGSADFELNVALAQLQQAKEELRAAHYVKNWGEAVCLAEDRVLDAERRVAAVRREICRRELLASRARRAG